MRHAEPWKRGNTESVVTPWPIRCFRVSVFRCLALSVAVVLGQATFAAAAVLRSANIAATMASATACEVVMTFAIDGVAAIDHRIEANASATDLDGRGDSSGSPASAGGQSARAAGSVELLEVRGARQIGGLHSIGRTISVVLAPEQPFYSLRYRAVMADARASRCPLWVPAVATDGRARAVSLSVDLPAGMRADETLPAFAWSGAHGVASLGNVPAFIRVPFVPDTEPRAWGIGRTMDGVAVVVFALATVLWLWRRPR
jgi:hypothetical protein